MYVAGMGQGHFPGDNPMESQNPTPSPIPRC